MSLTHDEKILAAAKAKWPNFTFEEFDHQEFRGLRFPKTVRCLGFSYTHNGRAYELTVEIGDNKPLALRYITTVLEQMIREND